MDNDQVLAVNEEAAASEEAAAPQAPKRAVRTRRKAAPKAEAVEAEAAPAEAPAADAAAEEKSPVRRSRSRKKVEPAEPLPVFADDSAAPVDAVQADTAPAGEAVGTAEVVEKPVRRRASRAKAPAKAAEAPEAPEPADALATEARDVAAVAEPAAEEEVVAAAQETEVREPAAPVAATEQPAAAEAASPVGALFLEPGSVTSMIFQAPDLSTVVRPAAAPAVAKENDEEDTEEDTEEVDAGGSRRRRSRGRRGRSRVTDRETAGEAESAESAEGAAGDEDSDEESTRTADDGVTSRRRRRRRRGDQDLELTGGGDDDPPNTVTRVRAPRAISEAPVNNRVTSVKGSTRLEAKKQRRRESRDTGRRRTVITEAEFLARRESVDRQMIVRQRDDRIQIGVLEDGVLAEHFVSKTQQDSLIGNVYLGKVQNVLPSMEAAFVDIGRGRNAVLYAGEVNWDAVNLEGKQRRIENALKSGDSVLVQVTKDPVGHKGARLTSQISLPGRYLVYVPGGSMTGISRKLPDVERNRLKRILKDRLPEDAGVIVRTAAEGASEEELTHDINRLRAQWEGIESQATSTKILAPELLYGEPDLTIKVVRDVFNEDFSKLIVSGEEAWDTIEAYVTYVAPDLVGRLEKWTKDTDIFAAWRIDEQIHKALDRKVFLPSGGSLVIDRTEAMTVVDVNTGKFTGSGGNLEETVTKNNLEAAEEVVRQLRLRDIGGIIVIDFIDMVLESNRDLVLRRMVECLGRDRTKHQVAEVTSLGLVQMTRKRMGTGLLEVFGEQCEACAGRGIVTHDEPVEHRRANTVAAEHHVQRTEAQQPPRTERKSRRRGKGGQPASEAVPLTPAPVHHEPTEAERHAKAEATRVALANIAAAAHAAHLHDSETGHAAPAAAAQASAAQAVGQALAAQAPSGQAGATAGEGAAQPSTTQPATARPAKVSESEAAAAGRPAAVLTFGGEKVALPFVEHAGEAPASGAALTLDRLAEAFAHLGEPAAAEAPASPAEQQAPSAQAPVEAPARVPSVQAPAAPAAEADYTDHTAVQGRARRPRRHRSASRAQGAANETSVEHHETAPVAASGHTHEAKAPEPAKKDVPAKAPASEPIILGVGVPASEL
ncbi:ribonuclease E [Arthrobacter sp. PvP102]|uniref:Rne/Rng family ribonuclease n=1 Tax=unclassified Arthrobacter TaxID=235627 RepID=UPI001AE3E019|nr:MULTISPECIES: Rne/Rng family ribonuclease [unclassified Arthrobacter]MBP1231696.1 ribonuclease E [Arthrobacter sp. PvP103]MBP1236831.1 ribonuclease E [Arthrobacter sp. PvP102]